MSHGGMPAADDPRDPRDATWRALAGADFDADPALALAAADMRAWSDAHPCVCEGLCVCADESVEDSGA